MPDEVAFEGALLGMSRADAERRIGCPGVIIDPNAASAADLLLEWQDPARPGRHVHLRFTDSGLFYKEAFELSLSGASSCVPSDDRFQALPDTVTPAGAALHFGCAGQRVAVVQTVGYREERFRWGSMADDQPMAEVRFVNGSFLVKQSLNLR